MDIKIMPALLSGTVDAISSKSDAHRVLIASALSGQPTIVHVNIMSEDIKATINCLRLLGATITEKDGHVLVLPIRIRKTFSFAGELDCKESGTTARFMLPLLAALYGTGTLTGHGRLPQRPFSPLVAAMRENGCDISANFPFKINSSLRSGIYKIPGNISSQFISALLISLPLLESDSEIFLTGLLESVGYVDMTLSTLNTFGVKIYRTEHGYFIPGKQEYRSPGTIYVEGDWSNAAFWLCAGAIGKEISVSGLNLNSMQGDRAIVHILKNFGADIVASENRISSAPHQFEGIEIEASDIPDLVPILASVSSFAKGTTLIKNVSRLRAKESDRIFAIVENLTTFGADISESNDSLIINYKLPKGNCKVYGFNDHRIVMSAAIVASACSEPVTIVGAEAVKKSYPGFFEDFKRLGGIAYVI